MDCNYIYFRVCNAFVTEPGGWLDCAYVGVIDHPMAKELLSREVLQQLVDSVNRRALDPNWPGLPIYVRHPDDDAALGWCKSARMNGDHLELLPEWNERGRLLILHEKSFKFVSLAFAGKRVPGGFEPTDIVHIGLTNTPVIKGLRPIVNSASEAAGLVERLAYALACEATEAAVEAAVNELVDRALRTGRLLQDETEAHNETILTFAVTSGAIGAEERDHAKALLNSNREACLAMWGGQVSRGRRAHAKPPPDPLAGVLLTQRNAAVPARNGVADYAGLKEDVAAHMRVHPAASFDVALRTVMVARQAER